MIGFQQCPLRPAVLHEAVTGVHLPLVALGLGKLPPIGEIEIPTKW